MFRYNFFTYRFCNYNRTVLYTGVTSDLSRRLYEHFTGEGKSGNFTAKYKCFYLVWYELLEHIDAAIAREKEIKGWTRLKKEALIQQCNPDWRFLNSEVMEWPPIVPAV